MARRLLQPGSHGIEARSIHKAAEDLHRAIELLPADSQESDDAKGKLSDFYLAR